VLETEKEYGRNEDSKNNTNESEHSDSEAESEIEAENSDSENTPFLQENNLNACQHCEGLNVNHPVVMECLKCFWQDNREICPV